MVGFPLFLITAFTLHGILSINFTSILLLILFEWDDLHEHESNRAKNLEYYVFWYDEHVYLRI